MRINLDCMREVLTYLIDHLEIKTMNNIEQFRLLSVNVLCENLRDSGYDRHDILYSVYNLSQCGYIVTNIKIVPSSIKIGNISIINVTFEGHQFAEAIRKDKVWEKTKTLLKTAGNQSFSFITKVAQSVASGLIKDQLLDNIF